MNRGQAARIVRETLAPGAVAKAVADRHGSGAVGDDACVASMRDPAVPSDDAEMLRALLAERDAALAERDALLLNARLEIEKLKVQLAALRRDRYGRSSARLAAEIGQLDPS